MRLFLTTGLLIVLSLLLPATPPQLPNNYTKALEHGLATIRFAQQFQELYPGSHNSYAYYGGVKNSPELQCQTLLYGRYELTLQIEVKFDDQRAKVISYGVPAFYLKEIDSVTFLDGGRADIRNGKLHHHFGAKEWGRLWQAHGDFSVQGLQLVQDKPVPNLEAWWKEEGQKY